MFYRVESPYRSHRKIGFRFGSLTEILKLSCTGSKVIKNVQHLSGTAWEEYRDTVPVIGCFAESIPALHVGKILYKTHKTVG